MYQSVMYSQSAWFVWMHKEKELPSSKNMTNPASALQTQTHKAQNSLTNGLVIYEAWENVKFVYFGYLRSCKTFHTMNDGRPAFAFMKSQLGCNVQFYENMPLNVSSTVIQWIKRCHPTCPIQCELLVFWHWYLNLIDLILCFNMFVVVLFCFFHQQG